MSWWQLIKHEGKAIFTHPTILLTVFGGTLFYFFLYPLPYSQQLPREQPVVVVNMDGSQLSRRLERMVDATPQVRIKDHAHTIEQAKEMLNQGKVAGLLIIPENFYRDLQLGRGPTLSYAADASYFVVYGTIVEGLAKAGGNMAAEVKVLRLVQSGEELTLAEKQHTAVKLNRLPVFNSTMGYVNYVVPGIFILILHQTLLIGTGVIGSEQNEQRLRGQIGYWANVSAWRLLVVRTAVFAAVYCLFFMFYFGFGFKLYDIPRLADMAELGALVVPFLLSVTFLGITLGQLIPRRELVTLLVLLSSMPIVFLAGFAWPLSAIPVPINIVAQLIPAVPGIQALLRLNQMGADFSQIIHFWGQLWVLAVLYGASSWWLLRRNNQQTRARDIHEEVTSF